MGRPNLFALDFWRRHEGAVLNVFKAALLRLTDENRRSKKEDELNRRLLFLIRQENYRLAKEGRGCTSPIYYECSNQPLSDDQARAPRESKRPDFICGIVDAQAGADRFFVVECKRLGRPPSPTWILNRNYTVHGVVRFVDPNRGYGAGEKSAAMVGYVQSMRFDDVLSEVNAYGHQEQMPKIAVNDRSWAHNGVTELHQVLRRSHQPPDFSLRHLWVDLRSGKSPKKRVLTNPC